MDKIKRNINLHFMASEEERDMITKRMEQSGIKSLRAYLLKMAIDGRVIQVELTSVKEMIRLLSSATNSLNQIAKRVNVTGSLYQNDLAAIRSHYEELWEQMRIVLRKLSEI